MINRVNKAEPKPRDSHWTRYCKYPFPPYRFIPGQSPHPRRDPRGHSFGIVERFPSTVDLEPWHSCQQYLYGIDLFNFAYWWESHEVLEDLWNAAGHGTPQGKFFQGIIFVAAAHLKRFVGSPLRGQTLAQKALLQLQEFEGLFMGVHVDSFSNEVRGYFLGGGPGPVLIRLEPRDFS